MCVKIKVKQTCHTFHYMLKTYLICHDHDLAITQSLEGVWVTVVLLVLKTKDLNDVVYLSVLHYLRGKNNFQSFAKLIEIND